MLVDLPPKPEHNPNSFFVPPQNLIDLASLRLMLAGESVVDLPRLYFSNEEQVDKFLRLCAFDTDNPIDLDRLYELHHDAVSYLTETQRYRLPPQLEELESIHYLFLAASYGPIRVRRYACMMLKVMHILHHIAGRELVFSTSISEAQLLDRLNAKVFNVIDRMRASGVGVQEFAAGQKTRTSLITKLLAKRGTLATHIFDKLRFRIIVNTREDIVNALLYLVNNLFPFNYVIPEQSQNGIVGCDDLGRTLGVSTEVVQRYWDTAPANADVVSKGDEPPANEFSGKSYRAVNFVADIPLRIDDIAPDAAPAIVFVQTEIQVIDVETEKQNQRGENNHSLYKKRQKERVKRRLEGPSTDAFGIAWQAGTGFDGGSEAPPQGSGESS